MQEQNKKDILVGGVVTEALPNTLFRVMLDDNKEEMKFRNEKTY